MTDNKAKKVPPRKSIPIGVPGAPWPTMIRHESSVGGQAVTSFELGVMEDPDNPMILHSNRSYPIVAGEFYRNMPVPSMLPALEFIISRAHPEQLNRVANLVSDPGTGKSFLAVLVGNVCDERGPIICDAGGKNLEFLLFETVFDVTESRTLTKAIDDALSNGKLDPVSIGALHKFGKHFSERDGRIAIDWNGLVTDQDIGTDVIRSTLELVRTVEHWDANKMGIGFKTKKGPLVVAHEEGRDLIIDEINKGKPGSETPLQIVWQVLNGEIAEHTVTLGSNGTFTFKRGQGGMVVCTGNLPKDGVGTHLVSESFDRRVPGYRIPNFNEMDWQHRICQQLTGLPVSTLHRMQKGEWKKDTAGKESWVIEDPEQFTNLLFTLRTLGLSEEQKRNIPEWQMSMIANWKGVLDSSQRLANFYHNWSQLVDPDSPALKTMPDVLAEIENPDDPTSKVTPSTMIRHIKDAVQISSLVKEIKHSGGFSASHNWDTAPAVANLDKEPVEAKFGSRLVRIIMDEVERNSEQVGKKQLFNHLKQHAENAGLIGPKTAIPTLLNVDTTKIQGASHEARVTQKILAAMLRAEHPDLGLSQKDDDIITIRQIQQAMIRLSDQIPSGISFESLSANSNVLYVPNTNTESFQNTPLGRVATDNRAEKEDLADSRKRLPPERLLSRVALLTALALPATGAMNLRALWNKSFTNGGLPAEEATAVAQNQSQTEIATTSLICKTEKEGKSSYTKLHVIHSGKAKKTLIVGEGDIPGELRSQLKKNGITYVDQNLSAAESIANSEIRSILNDPSQEALVSSAFLLRNWVPTEDEKKPIPSLAKLLTKPVTRLMVPHFITSFEPEKLPHAARAVSAGGTGGPKL